MPELPEVQTIVSDLKRKITGHKFIDLWSDWPKSFKPSFLEIKKEIKGRKIIRVRRRAKNILIDLARNKTLLIHLKMTGHLLYRDRNWKKNIKTGQAFRDPDNQYIRTIFFLDKNKELAFSDLRRFGKILWFDTKKEFEIKDLKNLGPEPLAKRFNFQRFNQALIKKTGSPLRQLADFGEAGRIKSILLDQTVISGIGNIYADEILWEAKIHPLVKFNDLALNQKKKLFFAIKKVLQNAVKNRGTSIADYRDLSGKKGKYQLIRKVYRRKGENCHHCENPINKIKVNNRGTYYCPYCQKNQ